MANLQKPNKGEVPSLEEASDNLGEVQEPLKIMSFRVPLSFNRNFKRFALDNDLSLTELFVESFKAYNTANKKDGMS